MQTTDTNTLLARCANNVYITDRDYFRCSEKKRLADEIFKASLNYDASHPCVKCANDVHRNTSFMLLIYSTLNLN